MKPAKATLKGILVAIPILMAALFSTLLATGGITNDVSQGINRDDEVPVDPGPGRGAFVVYRLSDGEIVALVGYGLTQPVTPVLAEGEAMLDVTGHPDLANVFADFRSGAYGTSNPLPWYVDLATVQLKARG